MVRAVFVLFFRDVNRIFILRFVVRRFGFKGSVVCCSVVRVFVTEE